MRKHSLKVLLTIATVCILFPDLTALINLLNMGQTGFSRMASFLLIPGNLLVIAGWVFSFWQQYRSTDPSA